jgi:hypothetical protein
MAKLPIKEAASLAEAMKKHNVPGAIAMGDPTDDTAEQPEEDEMTSCASDLAQAIKSGDESGIVSAIMALVDCIKSDDKEQDDTY